MTTDGYAAIMAMEPERRKSVRLAMTDTEREWFRGAQEDAIDAAASAAAATPAKRTPPSRIAKRAAEAKPEVLYVITERRGFPGRVSQPLPLTPHPPPPHLIVCGVVTLVGGCVMAQYDYKVMKQGGKRGLWRSREYMVDNFGPDMIELADGSSRPHPLHSLHPLHSPPLAGIIVGGG